MGGGRGRHGADEVGAYAADHYDTEQIAAPVMLVSFMSTVSRLHVVTPAVGRRLRARKVPPNGVSDWCTAHRPARSPAAGARAPLPRDGCTVARPLAEARRRMSAGSRSQRPATFALADSS
jgi:hypothetical protein